MFVFYNVDNLDGEFKNDPGRQFQKDFEKCLQNPTQALENLTITHEP